MNKLTANATTQSVVLNKNTLWYLIVTTAAIYPFLLDLFAIMMAQSALEQHIFNKVGFILIALTSIIFCICISFAAILLAAQYRDTSEIQYRGKRTFLMVLAATPPFYIVTIQIAGLLNIAAFHQTIWITSILATGVYLGISNSSGAKHKNSPVPYKTIRKIHLTSALLLMIGFIFLHIGNHVFALHSFDLHEKVRTTINQWYQSSIVEPLMFLIILSMMITGVLMVIRYLGTNLNYVRSIQMGSGVFLIFFFIAHVNAVLSARARNVETDWIFATGEQGLLASSGILIPYYTLSIAMILLHVSAGIRSAYLTKTKNQSATKTLFSRLVFVSIMTTLIVSAAVLGFQF